MKRRQGSRTRDVEVCWSMTSLTKTAHGRGSLIHGRSRLKDCERRTSARRNAACSLRPDVVTVRASPFRGILSLPDHDLATEVTDFETVLIKSFGFDGHDAAIVLRRGGVHRQHPRLRVNRVAMKRRVTVN